MYENPLFLDNIYEFHRQTRSRNVASGSIITLAEFSQIAKRNSPNQTTDERAGGLLTADLIAVGGHEFPSFVHCLL
jgi:hypothetical protein